jgi:hypothetical protein
MTPNFRALPNAGGWERSLYELNQNGHCDRMVVFCSIASGVIVAWVAGLFWFKVAIPAWRDFDQARGPHLPPSRPLCDLNDLLEKRGLARRGTMVPADPPINVREVA